MKYRFGMLSVVAFMALAMLGRSIAGRFMPKDDLSVMIGIIVVGTSVGLIAAGVAFMVRRMTKALSATASIDPSPFFKPRVK